MDENLTKAHNIFELNDTDKAKLKLVYDSILENIRQNAISSQLKNTRYLDIPERGGTVRVSKPRLSSSNDYGTARAAGEGDAIIDEPVYVKLNIKKEIIEEINRVDLERYGISGLVESRQQDHLAEMISTLDKAYFNKLQTDASTVDLSSETTLQDKISLLIRTAEAQTDSKNIDGIPREMLVLTLAPQFYDELESYTETLPNPLGGGVNARAFRRVEVRPAPRQTVDAVIQYRGAVAQPVAFTTYQLQRINLSDDWALALFYDYGVESIQPNAIFKGTLEGDISA